MSRENKPPRPRAHPAGALALVDAERADGAAVHRFDHANPLPVAGQPHEELVSVRDHLLDEHLFVVLLPERTAVVGGCVADGRFHRLQGHYLKGRLRRGARLGGQHPSEPGHAPAPHVVVLATHRHQIFFRQRHLQRVSLAFRRAHKLELL